LTCRRKATALGPPQSPGFQSCLPAPPSAFLSRAPSRNLVLTLDLGFAAQARLCFPHVELQEGSCALWYCHFLLSPTLKISFPPRVENRYLPSSAFESAGDVHLLDKDYAPFPYGVFSIRISVPSSFSSYLDIQNRLGSSSPGLGACSIFFDARYRVSALWPPLTTPNRSALLILSCKFPSRWYRQSPQGSASFILIASSSDLKTRPSINSPRPSFFRLLPFSHLT